MRGIVLKVQEKSDSLIVELPHFSKVVLDEHMTFVLVQDTVEKSQDIWWRES